MLWNLGKVEVHIFQDNLFYINIIKLLKIGKLLHLYIKCNARHRKYQLHLILFWMLVCIIRWFYILYKKKITCGLGQSIIK